MNASAAIATDFDRAMQSHGLGQNKSLLVFMLDERAYGLSIECVAQIIPMLKLSLVPQVEQIIEGVANIHGKIVPVLSGRRILGLPVIPHRLYTPIILTESHGRTIGLIVDEVDDVILLTARQVIAPVSILPDGVESGGLLEGVVYSEGKTIIVLNSQSLLRPMQLRALSEVIRSIPAVNQGGDLDFQAAPQTATVPEQPMPATEEYGRGKARGKRRKMDATLADEMANLAADLPPSEGQIGRPVGDKSAPSSETPRSE